MTTPDFILQTRRLDLLRASLAHLRVLIESEEEFARRYGFRVEEGFIEFPGAMEFSLHQADEPGEAGIWWLPYFFIDRHAKALIGVGGFKGQPGADGFVEIGYGMAPAWRGRGLATEAAAALVSHAFAQPSVKGVRAHTLPEPNASTKVLAKNGFSYVREISDPNDGTVWRWERPRADT